MVTSNLSLASLLVAKYLFAPGESCPPPPPSPTSMYRSVCASRNICTRRKYVLAVPPRAPNIEDGISKTYFYLSYTYIYTHCRKSTIECLAFVSFLPFIRGVHYLELGTLVSEKLIVIVRRSPRRFAFLPRRVISPENDMFGRRKRVAVGRRTNGWTDPNYIIQ